MNEIQSPEVAAIERPSYVDFAKAVELAFNKVELSGKPIFRTTVKKGVLPEIFLANFPEGADRQHETCACCMSFLNKFGRLAYIDESTNKLTSLLWSNLEGLDPYFAPAVAAMKKAVDDSEISSVWYNEHEKLGEAELGGHNHLCVVRATTHKLMNIKSAGQMMAETVENYRILSESVGKMKMEVIDSVLKFFRHDARLGQHTSRIDDLQWLKQVKETYKNIRDHKERKVFMWMLVGSEKMNRLRIGTSVMGNFIDSIDAGETFATAKVNFLKQTDGLTYGRAQSAPKAGTVMHAEKVFEAMGLTSSLKRRFATLAEMRHKVWIPKEDKPVEEKGSVFGHLKTKTPEPVVATPLPDVVQGRMMTWDQFAETILPQAEKLKVRLYPQPHPMNFTSVSTSVDPEAKPLVAWDKDDARNPFAAYQYYNGSHPRQWNLTSGSLVDVEAIVADPQFWPVDPAKALPDETAYIIVLKGAKDMALPQIPVVASTLRHDLHEIRSVLENFFKSGKMDEQPEDLPAFGGLTVSGAPGAQVAYRIQALLDGVWVEHAIDRRN